MSNKNSNFPTNQLNDTDPTTVRQITQSLRELNEMGQPTTDEEVADRIDQYFQFCERSSIRCGIESLCLALHVSRTTLFNWSNGKGCSTYRQEIIQNAKQFISSYLEQLSLQGRLNPATSIFLYKNWLGYRDTVSIEEQTANCKDYSNTALKASQLPILKAPNED